MASTGNLSVVAANQCADAQFGGQAFTPPATLYATIFTTVPTTANVGGVEATGGSYARVAVTNNLTSFPAAVSGAKTNGTDIVFVTTGITPGTALGVGFYDQSVGGNLRGVSTLATASPYVAGGTLKIVAGALAISVI